MIAVCRIRELPHYRSDAFRCGLEAAGYSLATNATPSSKEDLLCVWNRYSQYEAEADRWEANGGTVIVAENGYIGLDDQGRQYYAISVHGHNGSGWFPLGDEDRFAKLGIDLKPWRAEGEHIVIRGQRGIGTKQMASPPNWHHHTAKELAKQTDRPIKVIEHPGNKQASEPIAEYLENAYSCVVWASSVGVKALAMGIPVQYAAPKWIASLGATRAGNPDILMKNDVAREGAMRRVAYGQWSVAEIEQGIPFKRILERIDDAKW